MRKSYLKILLRLVVSLGLMTLLLAMVDRDALLDTFRSLNLPYFFAGLLVYFSAIGFATLRWYGFIWAAGEGVSFFRALMTLLIATFYSMFLPTIVGLDVGRMYELGRDETNRKSNVVSTVLLDRLMGMITLSLMAVGALVLGSQFSADSGIIVTVVGVLVVLVIGWLIFFNRRIMESILSLVFRLPVINRLESSVREIYEVLFGLHNRPRLLLATGTASLLNSLCEALSVFLLAHALGIEIDPLYFFIFMPLIWIIITVPVSISGLGLREGAFVFFFTQVGVSSADAVALSLLFYSFSVIVGIIGGLLLVRSSVTQATRLANANQGAN